MHGTLVCAVDEGAENDDAVAKAIELSERLGLRLVLAHVVAGVALDSDESLTMKSDRRLAERRLEELARDHDLDASAERRIAIGDPATLLGQIATEEAADVVVVGARQRGWARRGLDSRLAEDLQTETPVPVLIAPPRSKRQGANGAQRR